MLPDSAGEEPRPSAIVDQPTSYGEAATDVDVHRITIARTRTS